MYRVFGSDISPALLYEKDGVSVRLAHVPGDPVAVHRLEVRAGTFFAEIAPSKGLSVRDVISAGRRMFWDSPMEFLPDPGKVDLARCLLINGTEECGMGWLETFACHVELLGLFNWGMPCERNGSLLALHGNASNIPVTEVDVSPNREERSGVSIHGSFRVFDAHSVWPEPKSAVAVYRVDRRVEILPANETVSVVDTITNVSGRNQTPDWGYHVQLKPEPGARYLVPSRSMANRDGTPLPDDHDRWRPAVAPVRREERGIIHTSRQWFDRRDGSSRQTRTLLLYPDGTGIICSVPEAPYFQSWFSCGGGGGTDFVRREADGTLVGLLKRNWDGVGPELGASALDHDGNTDPEVPRRTLAPGEKLQLAIDLSFADREAAGLVAAEIEAFISGRTDTLPRDAR